MNGPMPVGTGQAARYTAMHKAGKMVGKETYCDFNLADILGVLEVNISLDAVAASVHWESCGVASVKYDIEAPPCTCMPWYFWGKADDGF